MPMTLAELEVAALEAAAGPGGGLTPAELHGAVIGIAVTDTSHFELQDLVDLENPLNPISYKALPKMPMRDDPFPVEISSRFVDADSRLVLDLAPGLDDDVPQILGWPVVVASGDYLKWARSGGTKGAP